MGLLSPSVRRGMMTARAARFGSQKMLISVQCADYERRFRLRVRLHCSLLETHIPQGLGISSSVSAETFRVPNKVHSEVSTQKGKRGVRAIR